MKKPPPKELPGLVRGEIYFTLYFLDKDFRVPIVSTYRYEKRINDRKGELYLFRELSDGSKLTGFPPNEVNASILTRGGLLERLNRYFRGKSRNEPLVPSVHVPAEPEVFKTSKTKRGNTFQIHPAD